MEETKNKKFNLINYIWIIPLVIGIIIGFIGISKINQANNIYVPTMGNDGWFDAKTTQSTALFGGIIMCIFGFCVIGIIGTIICYTIPRSIKAGKKHIKTIGTYINSKLFSGKSSKQEEQNLKECVYCGSLVTSDSTECDSCGGKTFKKYKQ